MLKSSPEQRIVLWNDVVRSEPDARATRVAVLAREIQSLVASPLDLYSDYDDDFATSIDLLSRSGLLGRDEFRLAFEDADDDRESATPLILAIAGLLGESADAQHLDEEQRALCLALRDRWLEAVPEEGGAVRGEVAVEAGGAPEHEPAETGAGYCTVAEVARHFEVTPQAVYRWIDKDLIVWERRPGGSYRIPTAQFEGFDLAAVRAASKRRSRTASAELSSAVSAGRDERESPDAGRMDPDDPASTFRKADTPRRTRRAGDRRAS
jgi:transposase-like protein